MNFADTKRDLKMILFWVMVKWEKMKMEKLMIEMKDQIHVMQEVGMLDNVSLSLEFQLIQCKIHHKLVTIILIF